MNANEAIKKAIEDCKTELNKERPCSACIYANNDCTWCNENKIPITKYMRGCRKYMTNEQALIAIAEEEMESSKKELTRLQLLMDIMSYMITGASMVMETIDKELDSNYNRLSKKDEDTTKNHHDSKRNRERLTKAYKRMKFSMQDIDSNFRNYVEHYFSVCFTEEDGKYNVAESDKSLVNSGMITAFVNMMVDRSLDNGENATAILDFIKSLKGSGILGEQDFNRYLVRR